MSVFIFEQLLINTFILILSIKPHFVTFGDTEILFCVPFKDRYKLSLVHKLNSLISQMSHGGLSEPELWQVFSHCEIDLGFLPQIQTDLEFCKTLELTNQLQCSKITLAPSHTVFLSLLFMPKYTQAARQYTLRSQTGCQPAMALLS